MDSADRRRLKDCKEELFKILQQEVSSPMTWVKRSGPTHQQKLAGASLLLFANKQDIEGALTSEDIAEALELGSEAYSVRLQASPRL